MLIFYEVPCEIRKFCLLPIWPERRGANQDFGSLCQEVVASVAGMSEFEGIEGSGSQRKRIAVAVSCARVPTFPSFQVSSEKKK